MPEHASEGDGGEMCAQNCGYTPHTRNKVLSCGAVSLVIGTCPAGGCVPCDCDPWAPSANSASRGQCECKPGQKQQSGRSVQVYLMLFTVSCGGLSRAVYVSVSPRGTVAGTISNTWADPREVCGVTAILWEHHSVVMSQTGQCVCAHPSLGRRCDQCREMFFWIQPWSGQMRVESINVAGSHIRMDHSTRTPWRSPKLMAPPCLVTSTSLKAGALLRSRVIARGQVSCIGGAIVKSLFVAG
ncbi:usherin [Lates japonicus]|uniref:Usherin n=1 Tax=Lates japonicus TaxID=270547 RepID=A0AAD3MQF4_LATJO|nr:usherin [Lates japonicus]